MLINLLDLEPEGRSVILECLQKTNCLRDLQAGLTDQADAVELDLSKAVDIEIKAAAGVFFGLSHQADPDRFPQTARICVEMFVALNDEFNFRNSPARGAMNN